MGPARNLKKSKAYLDKATSLIGQEQARTNHLIIARYYFYQGRHAHERRDVETLVELLLFQAKKELGKEINSSNSSPDEIAAAKELMKKITELEQESQRPKPR